jgi:hypothetical protein
MSKRKSGSQAAESPAPPGRVCILVVDTRTGDLVPTCQPVQIAELAKSET